MLNSFPDIICQTKWCCLKCNYDAIKLIIQASRVNLALCDAAEAGRAHGQCTIDNGILLTQGGHIRGTLNQGLQLGMGRQFCGFPFDRYTGGEPLIEANTLCGSTPFNDSLMMSTQFQYLRLSVFYSEMSQPLGSLVLTDIECQQVRALGGKWGLNGEWGHKNRLSSTSNWHDDDSILTIEKDSRGFAWTVYNEAGIPQYVVELIETEFGNILLPIRFLKRDGFVGPRRVFFPPEENIAIWYKEQPTQSQKNVILTYDPGPMLFSQRSDHLAIGCFPGGPSSIEKSDFSTLRGKECWIPIVDASNRMDVEFAVKLCARLRREYQNPRIVRFDGGDVKEIQHQSGALQFLGTSRQGFAVNEVSLSELCKLAEKHDLGIPDELESDYFGDLTDKIAQKHFPSPIINDLIYEGGVTSIFERDIPPMLLPFHFAERLGEGVYIDSPPWDRSKECRSVIFVDDECDCKAFHPPHQAQIKICDCRFISKSSEDRRSSIKSLIGSANLAILAASGLLANPDVCVELIRYCRRHNIAVMVFGDKEPHEKIKRFITHRAIATKIASKNNDAIAIISDDGKLAAKITPDAKGVLRYSGKLSIEECDVVLPAKTVPSSPYRSNELTANKELTPEQILVKKMRGLK